MLPRSRTSYLIFFLSFLFSTIFACSIAYGHTSQDVANEDDARNHAVTTVLPITYEVQVRLEFRDSETKQLLNTSHGVGTAFGVTTDGLVLTNAHVVRPEDSDLPTPIFRAPNAFDTIDGKTITVTFMLKDSNGRERSAHIYAISPDEDLALLEIDHLPGERFQAVEWELAPKFGDKVLVIGAPFAIWPTVTDGIVSNPDQRRAGKHFVQTNAVIEPGNSGGPLVLLRSHKILGVVEEIYNPVVPVGIGLGFAIPAEVCVKFIKQATKGR